VSCLQSVHAGEVRKALLDRCSWLDNLPYMLDLLVGMLEPNPAKRLTIEAVHDTLSKGVNRKLDWIKGPQEETAEPEALTEDGEESGSDADESCDEDEGDDDDDDEEEEEEDENEEEEEDENEEEDDDGTRRSEEADDTDVTAEDQSSEDTARAGDRASPTASSVSDYTIMYPSSDDTERLPMLSSKRRRGDEQTSDDDDAAIHVEKRSRVEVSNKRWREASDDDGDDLPETKRRARASSCEGMGMEDEREQAGGPSGLSFDWADLAQDAEKDAAAMGPEKRKRGADDDDDDDGDRSTKRRASTMSWGWEDIAMSNGGWVPMGDASWEVEEEEADSSDNEIEFDWLKLGGINQREEEEEAQWSNNNLEWLNLAVDDDVVCIKTIPIIVIDD
jgi:hypothetical protein